MADVETGRTPSLLIEDASFELFLDTIDAVVLLALDDVVAGGVAAVAALAFGVQGVIVRVGLLFFVVFLLHPPLALFQE